MYIMIIGGGETGYYLCRKLIALEHEVLMVETRLDRCNEIREELGSVALCGDGSEISVLSKAGISRAEMLIAVTDEDEDNLAVCQIAKQKFKVPQVIAKINSPRNEHIFAKLGIDRSVNVAELVLERVELQLASSTVVRLLSFPDNSLDIVFVRVTEGSGILDKSPKELSLPSGCLTCLFRIRGQGAGVLNQDTIFEVGDQLICSIPSGSMGEVRALLAGGQVTESND